MWNSNSTRQRKPNWSAEETAFLNEKYLENAAILDAPRQRVAKNQIWQKIEMELARAFPGNYRTVKELREKIYDTTKRGTEGRTSNKRRPVTITRGSERPNDTDDSSRNDHEEETNLDVSSSFPTAMPFVVDHSTYSTRSRPCPKKELSVPSLKRKSVDCVEELLNLTENVRQRLPTCISDSSASEEDFFALSIAAQLKKLHPALKIRAMAAIQQALFEQQQEQYQIAEIDSSFNSPSKS